MENKRNKNKHKNKNLLNFVITGLILVCVVLLVTEISINTMAEMKSNQSNQSYSVVMDDFVSGE